MTGKIARIVRDKGFGFISVQGNKDHFFHKSECYCNFDDLEQEDEVNFESIKSPKGPRATNVVLVEK